MAIMTYTQAGGPRRAIYLLLSLSMFWHAPLAAQLRATDLITAIRNDNQTAVREQLANLDADDRTYLQRYASVFLTTAAAAASPETFRRLFAVSGSATDLKVALAEALIAAFDNHSHAESLVALLLDLGVDPSTRTRGYTPLGRAAFIHARRSEAQGLRITDTLLNRGAIVNGLEDSGLSPLMWACNSDDLPLVDLLLQHAADPTLCNREGQSAISLAGGGCRSRLRSAGLIGNEAAANTNVTGQDPRRSLLAHELYQAASTGDRALAAKLLREGVAADVTLDSNEITPLMRAPDAAITRLLLVAGADPRRVDIHGWTALHHAVVRPSGVGPARELLTAGAEMEQRIENGQTPLLLTHLLFVETNDPVNGKALLTLLVRAGADINASDQDGETLLHLAAYNQNAAIAQAGVDLGADTQMPNKRGETAQDVARRLNAAAVLQVLERATVLKQLKTPTPPADRSHSL